MFSIFPSPPREAMNVRDSLGYTPLHFAGENVDPPTLALLLAMDADATALASDLMTPVDLLLERGEIALARGVLARCVRTMADMVTMCGVCCSCMI
jgi:hypothetical protein